MVNQPRLIDFSESTRVHMSTDVDFEIENNPRLLSSYYKFTEITQISL